LLQHCTLTPWVRGKPMAWDVTVPDTFAESHLGHTARKPGAAATKASTGKAIKYGALSTTHIFFSVTVETAGTLNQLSVELMQELGRRIAVVTGDTRETAFPFQRLSRALQRGNAIAFLSTFNMMWPLFCLISNFCICSFVLVGQKIIIIII